MDLAEVGQWLIGPEHFAAGLHFGFVRTKLNQFDSDLKRGTEKMEKHTDTDTKLLVAITEVKTIVQTMDGRVQRVENKVLNGD